MPHLGFFVSEQCDQIGRFLQVLGNKLPQKSSLNILVPFRAIHNNVTVMVKVCVYFLANFWEKLRNFFISSCGHTVSESITGSFLVR